MEYISCKPATTCQIAGGQSGAVSFVQRFGGALNLHPHVHCLLPDGLFVPRTDGDPLDFVPLPTPTTAEIEALTLKIARRLTAVIERRTDDESETTALLEAIAAALQSDLAAAVAPPLPSPQLALPEDREPEPKPLCAKVAGFSLHAAHAVAAGDRLALERLCRYGLRAPFAQGRLARRSDGRIVYHLRRPWPHAQGATSLVLEPLDLLRRLAALVPAPYSHLVRYHGAFANRSRWRPRLPPPPPPPLALTPGPPASDQPHRDPEAELTPTAPLAAPAPATTMPHRRRSLPWAQLLCRVFHLDALRCPRCTSAMAVLALISDPKVLTSIRSSAISACPPHHQRWREPTQPSSRLRCGMRQRRSTLIRWTMLVRHPPPRGLHRPGRHRRDTSPALVTGLWASHATTTGPPQNGSEPRDAPRIPPE